MEEEYDRYERINDIWPDVHNDSQKSEYYWNQNQYESNQPNKLSELYRAKERFLEFVEELGQFKRSSIREDVLRYCEHQTKKQKNIQVQYKPQTIIKKIDIRIEKMIKTKRIKRNWGEEDIKILIWIISKYSDLKGYNNLQKQLGDDDWKMIATLIPGVNAEVCMFKWLSLKKITLSQNCWSDYESSLLSSIVKERNKKQLRHNSEINDWKQISQQLYKLNLHDDKVYRNAKQCREHWTCYLSPQLKKGPWQLYEDVRLLKFIQTNKGMKKWSQISKFFQGRTENALKNRYTLIIQKQRKQHRNRHKNQLDLVSQYLQKCYVDQYTSQMQDDQLIYEEEENQKEGKKQIVKIQEKPTDSIRQYEDIDCISHVKQELEPLDQIFQQISQNLEQNKSSPMERDRYPDSSSISSFNNYSLQTRPTTPITPIKVEVLKFKDFEKLSLQNLRNIQPGVMRSDGTFKKVKSYNNNEDWQSGSDKKNDKQKEKNDKQKEKNDKQKEKNNKKGQR